MLLNIQYFGPKNRDNWPKIENSKPDSLFLVLRNSGEIEKLNSILKE